ncbi:MAG: MMPL family transporter [Gammaproteobacteria bacterium]
MEKIVKIATQWPKLVFAVLLLISAGAVLQLDKLTVDTSASVLMLADDPDKAFYQTLQETFGSDNIAIVYVEDKALFSRKKLQLLQSVTTQLAAIEGVEKVTSLFTLENVQTADTRLQAPLLIESIPETDAALESLRRTALNSPFARNILSSDGTATALYIHFRHALAGTAIDAHLVDAIEQAIAPLIREVVTFAPDDNTFERAFQVGAPYQRHLLATTLSSDLTLFVVLTLVVVLLCLGVYLKSPGSLLVLVVTAALSGLWSLACMALLQLPVTLLTALLPVLLIALGSLPGIRLLDHYRSGLREGQTPQAALWSMVDKLSPAFFLTFACSWLAVLSLRLNDILVLQQFATAASLALLFSFIITLILLPLYLSTFGHRLAPQPVPGNTAESAPDRVTGSGLFSRAADALIQAMPTNKMTVPLLAIVLAVLLGAGMVAIKSNNDPADFLSRSALLQSRNHLVTERLHGMQTFTIVFGSEQDGAFKDPALLNEIQKVQDFIQQLKLFDTSLAVTDLLSYLQRETGGGDMPYYGLPGTAGPAPNYLPALWDSTAIKPFVSADYKQAIVRVWHHYTTSQDLQQALTSLQAYTDSLDKRLEVRFSGADILLAAAADSLLSGQVKSLTALMLAMFVLISLLF